MSKIIIEQSNFLITGAWNPAIFQPEWLKKNFPNLVPDEIEIQYVVGTTGLLRYKINHIWFEPYSGRLVFIPEEVNEEVLNFIGQLAAGIYKLLPYTPIGAAGSNFIYGLDEKEYFVFPEINDNTTEYYENIGYKNIITKQYRHTFSLPDYELNITYIINPGSKFIHYNFDYKISKAVKTASEALVSNYKETLELNRKIIRRQ